MNLVQRLSQVQKQEPVFLSLDLAMVPTIEESMLSIHSKIHEYEVAQEALLLQYLQIMEEIPDDEVVDDDEVVVNEILHELRAQDIKLLRTQDIK